jgi:O-antigen/teichoic acid export membrane protein
VTPLRTSEAVENPAAVATFIASTGEDQLSVERPSITKSSKWVLAGTVSSRTIQLFTNILVARLLGPASFGLVGLASSLALTVSMFAALGFGEAINKYLAEFYLRDSRKGSRFASVIIWTALPFTGACLLGLWLMRGIWAGWVFPPSTSTNIIGLCLFLTLGNLLFALLSGVFSGLQRFREFTILGLLQAAAVALFAICLVFYGPEGAVTAYACGTFVSVLWGFVTVWRFAPAILKWPGLAAFKDLQTILNFSLPIWIGTFAFAPFVTFTFAFLAQQDNGPYQLGIFNTANGLRMLVGLVPGAIASVISPAIMQAGGTHGDPHAYDRLIDKSFSALIFITLTLFIPAIFLSDLIFTLYGRFYRQAFLLFIPLTASAAIGAIGALLPIVMLAKNKTWWAFVFGFIKSALMAALTVLLVPRFFATGLTWAVMTSEVAIYIMVLEFCILIHALPQKLRLAFYTSSASVLALMTSAIFLPKAIRWSLALPLTAAFVIYYVRVHSEMTVWLTSLVPGPLKPRAQRILGFIAA